MSLPPINSAMMALVIKNPAKAKNTKSFLLFKFIYIVLHDYLINQRFGFLFKFKFLM